MQSCTPQYASSRNANTRIAMLSLLVCQRYAQNMGRKESRKPQSPKRLGNIHTLNPTTTHSRQITSRTTSRPSRMTSRYRDISHIAYFTEKGHTGNRTRASAPIRIENISIFRERVVSNLKEQNLAYGSLGIVGYSMCGYFRVLLSDGRRYGIKHCQLSQSPTSSLICQLASILSLHASLSLLKSSNLKYSIRLGPTRAYLKGSPSFFRNLTSGIILSLCSCMSCRYFSLRCFASYSSLRIFLSAADM